MCKEYFLRDLRNTREKLSGKELKKVIEFFYLWQNLQDIFHLNVFEAFDPNFFVNSNHLWSETCNHAALYNLYNMIMYSIETIPQSGMIQAQLPKNLARF